ncbi:MAG TPA: hydrogenobyrinic acid a,c-diamide synthase (glutamine-hydrolyzing) [Chromatiales bacterium]|nr:hydrogenobyrinic acid a,c-diamide synthase (glutamine-hydrolyzing) [Chromatiales bacterium]
MSHLLISAAHKSSGKTTLTIGICAVLRGHGLEVQPFKKGPDYIDPLWLSRAAGRSCRNLDFFTMKRDEILAMFASHMQGAGFGIIEGNKGLYDGLDLDGSNSNAALATLLRAPVILVIDARGMTRGIAPLILGYQAFAPEIDIAGVILNKVGGSRHESKLRRVIEHYTSVPVVGAVHYHPDLSIDERHLGLIPSNEEGGADKKIRALGEAAAAQVDVHRLTEIADGAKAPAASLVPEPAIAKEHQKPVRIGYPRDKAFGFYYPDDLEVMRQEGAELVAFDAVRDPALPEVDGLFIGGGFPETAMEELEGNQSMRNGVKEFIESGGPVYAECGGLMYLARSLTWQGKRCRMAGVIDSDAVMHQKPQGRGYVKLKDNGRLPWPVINGREKQLVIHAHEFHYSALENLSDKGTFAFDVLRGTGVDGQHDGIVYKNMVANYTHMRNVGGNEWARRFVAHVRRCKYGE